MHLLTNPIALHRAFNRTFLCLAAITVLLFAVGTDHAWLSLALTGGSLLAGALVDLEVRSKARAVMAAFGLTLALFGLAPWMDLVGNHVA